MRPSPPIIVKGVKDMNEMASSMIEKGYEPLSVGRHASIGFRKSMRRGSRPLDTPVWFDTGRTMKAIDENGNPTTISRTICAYTEDDAREFREKGWRPVERR